MEEGDARTPRKTWLLCLLLFAATTLNYLDRPLGNGIFTRGTSIGALIAPSRILGIAGVAGWRGAFAGVASLGLFWLVAGVPFTSDARFSKIWKAEGRPAQSPAAAYGEIL